MFLPSPRRLAAIAAVVTALSIPLYGADPVIEVAEHVQFEPGRVSLTLTLPRNRDDVYMCWGWVRYFTYRYKDGRLESRDEGRRSCMQLNGEHDLPRHYPIWRQLEWGEYVGFLEIYRKGDSLDQPYRRTTVGFQVLRVGDE